MLKFCPRPVKSFFPKKLLLLLLFIFFGIIFFLAKPAQSEAAGTIYNHLLPTPQIHVSGYPGPNPKDLIDPEQPTIYVLDANGNIYNYNSGAWSTYATGYSALPGATTAVAFESDGPDPGFYVLDANGNIYNYNSGAWSTYATGYSALPGATNAVEFSTGEGFPGFYVLDANGNIYNYNSGAWSTYATSFPGIKPAIDLAIIGGGRYHVLDSDGNIYLTEDLTTWTLRDSGFPGVKPVLDFKPWGFSAYVLDNIGNVYTRYPGGSPPSLNYPGSCPQKLEVNGSGVFVLDCADAGTLNVKVFDDKNNNGLLDSGETFSSFGASTAAVVLDGATITPNATGDYVRAISATPSTHILGVDPNETNGWRQTRWSRSSGPTCVGTGCNYTISGSYYNTSSFEVAPDGIITVYLGVSQADLIVDNPPGYSPPSPVAGGSITFTGTVRNIGGVYANASTTRWCLDLNPVFAVCDIGLNAATGVLAPGATENETWLWGSATAGTHSFRICADDLSVVVESNESNNCSYNTFTVSSGPDLITESLNFSPSSPAVGNLMTFSGVVRNQGGSSAAASSTRLRIDITNNGTWDVLPANQATGSLAVSATETETWSNAWTAVVGTHLFEICADATSVVSESNESNNCSTQTFTVASAGTLQVRVFWDKDNDGIYDTADCASAGPNCETFGAPGNPSYPYSPASVFYQSRIRLDSTTTCYFGQTPSTCPSITADGFASYNISASVPHYLYLQFNPLTFWDGTRWDNVTPGDLVLPAIYTPVSGQYRTGSFSVAAGNNVLINLGIRQMGQLTVQYFNDKNYNGVFDAGEEFDIDGIPGTSDDFTNVVSVAYIASEATTNITPGLAIDGIDTRLIAPNYPTFIATDIADLYHWRETKWYFDGDAPSWQDYPTWFSPRSNTGTFQLAAGTIGTVYLGVTRKDFLVTANGPNNTSLTPNDSYIFNLKVESQRGFTWDGTVCGTPCWSPAIPLYADGNISLSQLFTVVSCDAGSTCLPSQFTLTLTPTSVSINPGSSAFPTITVTTTSAGFGDYNDRVTGTVVTGTLPEVGNEHHVDFLINVQYGPWFQTQGGDVGSVGAGYGSGSGSSFVVQNSATLYNANPGYLLAYNKDKDGFVSNPTLPSKQWYVDEGGNLGTKPSFYNELWNSLKQKATDFDTNGSLPCPATGDCVLRYTGVTGGFPFIPGPATCSRACIVFIPDPSKLTPPVYTRSLDINANFNTSGTNPVIFSAEGVIYITKNVTSVNAFLVSDLITVIGGEITQPPWDVPITIRGGIIGNSSAAISASSIGGPFFFADASCTAADGTLNTGGVCFGRNLGNTANEFNPAEIIIWEPRYLALLRQIAGIARFSWTEIAP